MPWSTADDGVVNADVTINTLIAAIQAAGGPTYDYRQINPAFGRMADLTRLAGSLRERGMSLCVDLVLNHTAKEHAWAKSIDQSLAGMTGIAWSYEDPSAAAKVIKALPPSSAAAMCVGTHWASAPMTAFAVR